MIADHDPGDEDDGARKEAIAALTMLFAVGGYPPCSIAELRARLDLPEPALTGLEYGCSRASENSNSCGLPSGGDPDCREALWYSLGGR